MILVEAAPPFATIQDLGRPGFRDSGVPVSGIADRDAGLALNALLGNEPGAAMIEWAVTGGALRFETSCLVAIGGAAVECTLDDRTVVPWRAIEARAGSTLVVTRFVRGRFLLIAVRGGIDVPLVLGSRSTLLSAALGGLDGRRLRTGDRLPIGGALGTSGPAHPPTPGVQGEAIHVTRGPQAERFDAGAWAALTTSTFSVSHASDRTGYRLEGGVIPHRASAALPSEPACVGAVQVPEDGRPIVIMPDGPTIGGYPKIAVIRTTWMSRFAQLAPGDPVRFVVDG